MNKTAPQILIAEDNDVSRDMMTGVLQNHGCEVHGATDGGQAIRIIETTDIDMALVDLNMTPMGGFEFVKYLNSKNIKIPVVVITGDESSDMLSQANALGIMRLIQKPIQPERLVQTVERVLKRIQKGGVSLGSRQIDTFSTPKSPDQLMTRAIELAGKNASSGKGGPFGAVVADKDGQVVGEGVNGISSRIDPTAHAEVMAIRNAAEKLGRADLSECSLYCSSEPTMMGRALIISVGIKHVYYGLSHNEIRDLRESENLVRAELANLSENATEYSQKSHDEAFAMFTNSKAIKRVD